MKKSQQVKLPDLLMDALRHGRTTIMVPHDDWDDIITRAQGVPMFEIEPHHRHYDLLVRFVYKTSAGTFTGKFERIPK